MNNPEPNPNSDPSDYDDSHPFAHVEFFNDSDPLAPSLVDVLDLAGYVGEAREMLEAADNALDNAICGTEDWPDSQQELQRIRGELKKLSHELERALEPQLRAFIEAEQRHMDAIEGAADRASW